MTPVAGTEPESGVESPGYGLSRILVPNVYSHLFISLQLLQFISRYEWHVESGGR